MAGVTGDREVMAIYPLVATMAGMKSYRHEITLNVPARRAFINITPQVEDALVASGIREGLCLVKIIGE